MSYWQSETVLSHSHRERCPVSHGQAWTSSNCVGGPVSTDQIGTGTKCYVSGGALRVDSMAWNHAANKRGSEAIAGTVQPDSFKLVVEGVHKVARIPAKDGALKAMVAFFNAGNFTGLEALGAAN